MNMNMNNNNNNTLSLSLTSSSSSPYNSGKGSGRMNINNNNNADGNDEHGDVIVDEPGGTSSRSPLMNNRHNNNDDQNNKELLNEKKMTIASTNDSSSSSKSNQFNYNNNYNNNNNIKNNNYMAIANNTENADSIQIDEVHNQGVVHEIQESNEVNDVTTSLKLKEDEDEDEDDEDDANEKIGKFFIHLKLPDDETKNIYFDYPEQTIPTLGELRTAIHEATGYESSRQRIIFLGQLIIGPDSKSLKEYKTLKSGCWMHLMPLPKQTNIEGDDAKCNTQQEEGRSDDHPVNNRSLENVHNSSHLIPIIANRNSYQQRSSRRLNPSYNESGRTPEQEAVIRAKVRFYSLLMLFYYLMNFIEGMTLWTKLLGDQITSSAPSSSPSSNPDTPSDDHDTSGKQHMIAAHTVFFQMLTSILGIHTALKGIRATATNSLSDAHKFYRGVKILAFVYIIMTFIGLSDAKSDLDESSSFAFVAFFVFLIVFWVWSSCVITASQFYRLLLSEEEEEDAPISSSNGTNIANVYDENDEGDDIEQGTQVIQSSENVSNNQTTSRSSTVLPVLSV